MLFTDELRNHVGELVQVVTAVEIIAGVLLSVTDGAVIVRTSPSYGPPEDVVVRIPIIAYVRLEG
ncbi:hypothetical protein CN575_18375 [Bacillus wiedmannii]|mgnify:FL=1|jgi:hypothetical protein|uniref:Group-specific protein n=20 Tax=Bacillus TaxID=1386 RepID=Q81IA9_BACCR|nr:MULTISPECIES: hypothetical protein [Bacillus]AZJ18727.1 hypothetical protein CT694_02885 [Bacillus wiedmannii bv. thuringiensis]MBJ6721728.1 hypothetical protein [Bacillus sp. PR5]MBR3336810.1 hypothetical protein [Bacillus sp. (in: firmicutes)]MCU7388068.1 hypothetical protein [Bacillus sp. ST24]MCZ2969997.1 hypothetical protein [Acinetobacter baumannii]MDA0175585.1 hypothetical protein [Solirubrobacter taibaiensis]MDD1367786.1 hypothetical protein [Bacillus sp. MHSD17]MDV8115471.1 hypo